MHCTAHPHKEETRNEGPLITPVPASHPTAEEARNDALVPLITSVPANDPSTKEARNEGPIVRSQPLTAAAEPTGGSAAAASTNSARSRWMNPAAPFRAALSVRNIRLLLVGLAVSQAGDWLYNLALLALVYGHTHSSVWVGLTTAARILPEVALGPLGGILADRIDRQQLMIGSDVIRAGTMAMLALVVTAHAQSSSRQSWPPYAPAPDRPTRRVWSSSCPTWPPTSSFPPRTPRESASSRSASSPVRSSARS